MAVISMNPETLGSLEGYLRGAGVDTNSSRFIHRVGELVVDATAVVLFPDEYAWEATVSALSACRTKNPGALMVLVTRTPQRFEALQATRGGTPPLVVPRPAWSWTILDAIRAHLSEQAGAPSEK